MSDYDQVIDEKEIIEKLNSIELLPMRDAREIASGDYGVLNEMAVVAENKGRSLRILKLLGDLVSIRKRNYYKNKGEVLDSLTDAKLKEVAQVRSNKDSYAKTLTADIRQEWDHIENRYRYYDKLHSMLEERINLYKKFLKPEG